MPKILFLTAYPEEDASCRYRVHQFVPYLEEGGYQVKIVSFASDRLFRSLRGRGQTSAKALEFLRCSAHRIADLRTIGSYDFVVIHREAFPFFAPAVERLVLHRARPSGRTRVLFSFDDAIYAGHEDVSDLSHPYLYRWKHGRGYDAVIRSCEHVIAGNRILAEYAKKLNPSVTVIPTVVDCGRYRMRAVRTDVSRPVVIGWMGSRTTAPHLRIVESALRGIAEKYGGRVCFRFVGCSEYSPDLRNSESLPFRLEAELQDLRQFDIGLMPLPDNRWTRGKCAFKAIQYMASGVAVVASPVGITPDIVQHGANGLLASSEEEWFLALDRLVEDVELRLRLTQEARRTVEAGYSLEVWGPRMVDLFDQFVGKRNLVEQGSIAA